MKENKNLIKCYNCNNGYITGKDFKGKSIKIECPYCTKGYIKI